MLKTLPENISILSGVFVISTEKVSISYDTSKLLSSHCVKDNQSL